MTSMLQTGAAGQTAFSFGRGGGLAIADLQLITKAMQTFTTKLSRQFSDFLGIPISAELAGIREQGLEDYRNAIYPAGFLLVFSIEAWKVEAAVEFDSVVVSAVLEMLLGGGTEAPTALTRDLTSLEMHLLEGSHPILERALNLAWEGVPGSATFVALPVSAPLAFNGARPPADALAIADLTVQILGQQGRIRFAIPGSVLRYLGQENGSGAASAPITRDPEHESRMLSRIQPGTIRADVILSGASISMRDLIALEPGDIIGLEVPLDRPVGLRLNGLPVFEGFVQPVHGKRALRLTGDRAAAHG